MAIIPSRTTAVASSKVLATNRCQLHGFNVVNGASAGYVLVYDLPAAPSDGTVTPVKAYVLPADSSMEVSYSPTISMVNGCTIAFSTTGPFTQTLSATAFISGEAN